MATPQNVPWGGPFIGYDGHHKPREVPRTHIEQTSRDWMVNHSDDSIYARDGFSLLHGDPDGVLTELEQGASPAVLNEPRAVQIEEFRPASFTPFLDGVTYAILWMEEDASTAAPSQGVVAYYCTQGLLAGTTMYPLWQLYTTPANYPASEKPCPWLAGARGATAGEVATVAKGSRNFLDQRDWLFMPNYAGIPSKWNRSWGASSRSLGLDIERLFPWGHIPPWQPPLVSANGSTADTSGGWLGSERFYYSVMFKYRDGSLSMPFVPRPPQFAVGSTKWLVPGSGVNPWNLGATYPGGFGLVAVDATTPTNRYRAMSVRNIPIGEADVVERWLLRSPKVDTALSLSLLPDILDLRLVEIIPNNTQTAYEDYKSDDNELEEIPDLMRFDHIWPPSGRKAFTFDQRVAIGNCAENPCAILIGPAHFAGTQDDPTDDVTAAVASPQFFVYKSGTTLTLIRYVSPGPATTISIININKITLQELVDIINTNGIGAGGDPTTVPLVSWAGTVGWWRACLVPGADGQALASTLDDTNPLDFLDGTAGYMRCFANSWPGILTYAGHVNTSDRQKFTDYLFFTGGGPGHAPNATQNFYLGNFRNPPTKVGDFIDGGELVDGAVVLYSRGVGLMRNVRDGKTGVDEDYRLELMNNVRGCIAPWSVVRGSGFVGYLTPEGYFINDGRTERCISNDLYDPGTETGILAYEIAESIDAIAAAGYGSRFHAHLNDSWLTISFRSSASASTPDVTMVYDFSQGVKRSEPTGVFVGADSLFRDDGITPWGWSAPLKLGVSAIGRTTLSGLPVILGAVDGAINALYGTGFGLVRKLFDGITDAQILTVDVKWTSGNSYIDPFNSSDIPDAILAVIGSSVPAGGGIPAATVITDVDRITGRWTINNATTLTGNGTFNFYTRIVNPVAVSRLDDWGQPTMTKHLANLSVIYHALGESMDVYVTRALDGTGYQRVSLDVSGANDGYTRRQVSVPLSVRAPSDAHQLKLVAYETTSGKSRVNVVVKNGYLSRPPR